MANIKPVDIPNQYREAAQEALQDVMDENPDTVIILSFWKDRGQFKIKTSATQDRLQLIGALTEALHKVVNDGYTS